MARVLDSGNLVLAEDFVTATSGSGTRGTFDATIAFDRQVEAPEEGTLVVFEASAEDGSAIHVISIPVELEP
jgi:hypothetical protein